MANISQSSTLRRPSQVLPAPASAFFLSLSKGHEFKDFDIWVKAGGPRRAYVETVPVEVTNGEFRIVFTRQVENPAINAIEIIPQTEAAAGAASPAATIRIKAGLSTPFTDSNGHVWQPDRGFEGGGMGGMLQMPGGFGGGPGGIRGGGRWWSCPGGFGGGFGGLAGEVERPMPRLSQSTSRGSGSTCNSPPERSSASPRPTASFSGGMTSPPIGWASIAPRRSIRMAWSSPPRPMVRAVDW